MVDNFGLCTRAVEKNKTSITSAANPFLQPPENYLSRPEQAKWFMASLPIP